MGRTLSKKRFPACLPGVAELCSPWPAICCDQGLLECHHINPSRPPGRPAGSGPRFHIQDSSRDSKPGHQCPVLRSGLDWTHNIDRLCFSQYIYIQSLPLSLGPALFSTPANVSTVSPRHCDLFPSKVLFCPQ